AAERVAGGGGEERGGHRVGREVGDRHVQPVAPAEGDGVDVVQVVAVDAVQPAPGVVARQAGQAGGGGLVVGGQGQPGPRVPDGSPSAVAVTASSWRPGLRVPEPKVARKVVGSSSTASNWAVPGAAPVKLAVPGLAAT